MGHIEHGQRASRRTTALAFLLSAVLPVFSSGCGGENSSVVSMIEAHVHPSGIEWETDRNGTNRIVGLGLPNTEQSLEILPQLIHLQHLQRLSISYAQLDADDLDGLPELPNLKELRVQQTTIGDAGLEHLAPMKKLEGLDLLMTRVRGPGLAHLKGFTKLLWLDLNSAPLDDTAIPHIVANFPRLKRLDLANTDITADGLMLLADLHWLETLSPPANIVGPDPKMGETKQERRRLEKVRQRTRMILMNKFHDAHVASKQKARAAGSDVPPDHRSPFGVAKRMLEAHDRVYDENGRIRPGIQ